MYLLLCSHQWRYNKRGNLFVKQGAAAHLTKHSQSNKALGLQVGLVLVLCEGREDVGQAQRGQMRLQDAQKMFQDTALRVF